MAHDKMSLSVPDRTSAPHLPVADPVGGLSDNRSLTVVVINFPVAAGPARSAALRPAKSLRQWCPALPHGARQNFGRRIAVPTAALLLAGVVASWWAMPRGARNESTGVVRIQLPPPSAEMLSPPNAGAHGSSAVAQVTPAPTIPARTRSASPGPAGRGVRDTDGSLVDIGDLPEVSAATVLALRSGVAQNWQAKGLSGIAVAGPLQLEGSNVCRTVAVLADGGTGGQTVRSVRCMTRAGKWIRHVPASGLGAPMMTDAARPGGSEADPAADEAAR